jgi:hypothetical protein
MPPKLPEPRYIDQAVEGALYNLPDGPILLAGSAPPALRASIPTFRGTLIVRYGIPLNVRGGGVVIPGLFVSERGAALVGRAAWDFIQQHFQMYPRADVIGLNGQGGKASVWLRELDFGARLRVFVYRAAGETEPLAEPVSLVQGQYAPALPPLLEQSLSALQAP